MLKGIQQEGFSLDNSSRNESFMQNTSNKISLFGDNKPNEKKEYNLQWEILKETIFGQLVLKIVILFKRKLQEGKIIIRWLKK